MGAGPSGEVLVKGYDTELRRHDLRTLLGANWLNDEVEHLVRVSFFLASGDFCIRLGDQLLFSNDHGTRRERWLSESLFDEYVLLWENC